MAFYEPRDADVVLVFVKAIPGARKPGMAGAELGADGRQRLKVKVAQPPEDGAANQAIGLALAQALGVGRNDVQLTSGPTHRLKTFAVSGDVAAILLRLEALL